MKHNQNMIHGEPPKRNVPSLSLTLETTWLTFPRRHFQMYFLEWKGINFDWYFTGIVPKGSINNIPGLVQKMACRRPGDKPLSELMMGSLLTHICVTRPQWVDVLSSLSVNVRKLLDKSEAPETTGIHWSTGDLKMTKPVRPVRNVPTKYEVNAISALAANVWRLQSVTNGGANELNGLPMPLLCFQAWNTLCQICARPTKHISIEFEIRWKFKML